jgi:hypothetical protein
MISDEYLSSNTRISYPFKHGQDLPEQLVRIFADACIRSNTFDEALTQAEYRVSTGIFSFIVGGLTYSAYVTAEKAFCVIGSEGCSFVVDMRYLDTVSDLYFEGTALFEDACFVPESKTVTSIEIYNGEDDPRNAIITGDVAISFGYNVEAAEEDEAGTFRINATPGGGIGTVPCDDTDCEDDPETSGEPIPVENGNAVITADDCYEITASGSTIQIHGKCTACCQCQDYLDIVAVLKGVAGRVENTKKDLTGDKTDTYFDFVHKQALKNGYPDLDIQLDISPDADIASIATNGELEKPSEFHSFRVTATITNMSGVPCLIMTPSDSWTGSDIAEAFSHWVGSGNRTLVDGSRAPLGDCMTRGMLPLVCTTAGYLAGSSMSISSKKYRNDPAGWLVYCRSRGPIIRQLKENNDGIRYAQPNTTVPSGSSFMSRLSSNADAAKSMCTSWAVEDLNKGSNPSGMLDYADSLTDTIIKHGGESSLSGGFLAPAGYSFTVSWAYAFPGTALSSIKSIIATYCCYAYAPMIAYSMAYNFAKPELKTRKTSDGTVYYNTWREGDYTIPDYRLFRPQIRWAAYDIGNGKQVYRGNEDSKWK